LIISYFLGNTIIDVPALNLIIYRMLLEIPKGKVTTYGAIAKALGDIIAARAVAEVLSRNPLPEKIPCYKVIMSNGSIGGYTAPGGVKRKRELLFEEGVINDLNADKINLSEKFFSPKVEYHYLEGLKRIQEYLRKNLKLKSFEKEPKVIVGIDLAYVSAKLFDFGIAVAVAYNTRSHDYIGASFSVTPVLFPYIPTYLAFRELPAALFALYELEKYIPSLDVIIIDGQGILHPRGLGIASHLGIYINKPTIGVAKKLLSGKIGGEVLRIKKNKDLLKVYSVILDNELRGYLIEKTKRKKIIVSPGNLISVQDSLDLILKLPWTRGNTIDVVYLAHKLVSSFRDKIKNILTRIPNHFEH